MKRQLIMLSGVFLATSIAFASEGGERVQASRAAVKAFAGQLKGELVGAMKSGGPLKAVGVCHSKAPAIAQRVSEAKGMVIGRTSLKTRNPANAPDAWERQVLETFEQRKARGESPKKMEYSEIVEHDGKREFRYMKAIPTGKVCLVCHGGSIAPELAARLDELYPQDQARGFRLGDIRGAFSVRQVIK